MKDDMVHLSFAVSLKTLQNIHTPIKNSFFGNESRYTPAKSGHVAILPGEPNSFLIWYGAHRNEKAHKKAHVTAVNIISAEFTVGEAHRGSGAPNSFLIWSGRHRQARADNA